MQIKQCERECDSKNGLSKDKKGSLFLDGSVAKWLRQRIANPPSSVQLRPEPLTRKLRFFLSILRETRGFFRFCPGDGLGSLLATLRILHELRRTQIAVEFAVSVLRSSMG